MFHINFFTTVATHGHLPSKLKMTLEGYVNVVHIGVEGVQHFVTIVAYIEVSFIYRRLYKIKQRVFLLVLREVSFFFECVQSAYVRNHIRAHTPVLPALGGKRKRKKNKTEATTKH
jgi:hypothetical protein